MSEFFLDTELQEKDQQRIARVLAASPYSEVKLEEILRFEVSPLLKWNLLGVAGEWAGFDEAWLREKLVPRIDVRPFLGLRIFSMTPDCWPQILRLVERYRTDTK